MFYLYIIVVFFNIFEFLMYSIDGFQRAVRMFENKGKIGILTPNHAVKFAKNLQKQEKCLFRADPLNPEIIRGNGTINKTLAQMAKASQDPLAREILQGQQKKYESIIQESLVDKSEHLQQRYEEMQVRTEDRIKCFKTAVILRKAKNIQIQWSQLIGELDQEYKKWLPFFSGNHRLVDDFLSDLLTLTYKSHQQLTKLESCFALSPVSKDDSCVQVLSLDDFEN